MVPGTTKTDRKLLQALAEAGGTYPSKFKLIMDADVNYMLASDRMRLLARKGLIKIKITRPGHPHQVTLVTRMVPKLPPEGGTHEP